MNKGIVRTREDQAEALKDAFMALSRIMLSSAYNSHYDPEFKEIIDFEEFVKVNEKIAEWHMKFEDKMKTINTQQQQQQQSLEGDGPSGA